jgi:hypothetical protein
MSAGVQVFQRGPTDDRSELPTGQVIARNSQHKFERFDGILANEGQN